MSLFKLKTREGYTFKVLAELLQNSLKECCFECKPTGIYLKGVDVKKSKLICLTLMKEKFIIYKIPSNEDLLLGLNLIHFYKLLKSIKRKDALTLSIDKEEPTKLIITIEHPGESNPIVKHINITKIQPVSIEMPGEDGNDDNNYNQPIIATTKEFQKLKTLNKMSKYIQVTYNNRTIKFFCDKENIYSCTVEFGEHESSIDDEEEEMYTQKFETEQIMQLIKVAGLSQNISIHSNNSLPLNIKIDVGSLGSISIYIKSQEELENKDEQSD